MAARFDGASGVKVLAMDKFTGNATDADWLDDIDISGYQEVSVFIHSPVRSGSWNANNYWEVDAQVSSDGTAYADLDAERINGPDGGDAADGYFTRFNSANTSTEVRAFSVTSGLKYLRIGFTKQASPAASNFTVCVLGSSPRFVNPVGA